MTIFKRNMSDLNNEKKELEIEKIYDESLITYWIKINSEVHKIKDNIN